VRSKEIKREGEKNDRVKQIRGKEKIRRE